jgi:ribonuclease HI
MEHISEHKLRRWNIHRISQKKKSYLARVIRHRLNERYECWQQQLADKGDNEALLRKADDVTKDVNFIISETIMETLKQGKNKVVIKQEQKLTSQDKHVRSQLPRKLKALRKFKTALDQMDENSCAPDTPLLQSRRVASLTLNLIALSILPEQARQWTIKDAGKWMPVAKEIEIDLKKARRNIARNLIPNSIRIRNIFTEDRAKYYSLLFRKPPDRLTHIEKDGHILEGPHAVNEIRETVAKIFGNKRAQPEEKKTWVNQLYHEHKKTIPTETFQNIMTAPTEKEIRKAIFDTTNGKTGLDGISNDILKLIIREEELQNKTSILLETLMMIISMILHTAVTPPCLRDVIMKMIPKNSNKSNNASNMRPISIIPEIAKLIGKILAKRVTDILTKFPHILHKNQRGFLRNGHIGQNIDVMIDILEDNMNHKHKRKNQNLHVASYDQRKAYDSVQHYTIRMSLERLNFPNSFISYVMSSLQDSHATITTDLGVAKPFPLLTSVKQGDPLAPLLFVFVVDPLHHGIDRNPLCGDARDGYIMKGNLATIAATAYADDFTTMTNSWAGLQRVHNWIKVFFEYHCMDFNTDKSFFTCAENIRVDQETGKEKSLPGMRADEEIKFQDPSNSWRHLGILLNLQLDWKDQITTMNNTLTQVKRVCKANQMPIMEKIAIIREYLIPRFDLGVTHAIIDEKQLQSWDSQIRTLILDKSSIRGKKSISKSAFHLITNIPSMKGLEQVRKCNELFIRLNSPADPPSDSLWSRLSITTEEKSQSDIVAAFPRLVTKRNKSYLIRSAKLAEKVGLLLEWNEGYIPQDSKVERIQSQNLTEWQKKEKNPYCNPNKILVYEKTTTIPWKAWTDGSTPYQGNGPSGIGILLRHPDYNETKIAEPFKATGENYIAEMMGILVAMRLVPGNHPLVIYTDSLSAKQALEREHDFFSERQWCRTAARPIVRSIMKIMKARTSTTEIKWIRAHTGQDDEESKGNQVADSLANEGRRIAELINGQLPDYTFNENKIISKINPTNIYSDNKSNMYQHVIGDLSAALKREYNNQLLKDWMHKKNQGELVRANPRDALELCRIVRLQGNNELMKFYLEALTQTADTHERRETTRSTQQQPAKEQKYLTNVKCLFCKESDESLRHLLTSECPVFSSTLRQHHEDMNEFLDPYDLLNNTIQWFKDDQRDTEKTWKETFQQQKDEVIEEKLLTYISKHDRLAGMLGILPPRIDDILLQYHKNKIGRALNDSDIKYLRTHIHEALYKVRTRCIWASFRAWKIWKRTKNLTLKNELKNNENTKLNRKETQNKIKRQRPMKVKLTLASPPRSQQRKRANQVRKEWRPRKSGSTIRSHPRQKSETKRHFRARF